MSVHLSPFTSVPDTEAVGVVESEESNWRVSRLSAAGRSVRREGVGFRVDMEQTPFFQEARPTDRSGAHLERRSKLDPNPVSSRSAAEGFSFMHP
jgi:hypothetical protein